MATRAGVGSSTVQRIWSARGIKPHRVDTFKLSNDPRFEEKLVDVVGLYLNPPENAIVLCMDEKSQIQGVNTKRDEEPGVEVLADQSGAASEMEGPARWAGGPPRPPFGGRSQTTASCCGQEPWW